jgi:2-oxoglutarate dehydrogenase E2 component (dihydrolipoamide succinyltransferase)
VLEATVSRWLKQEGDFVNVGELLVELETDKVNLEVGAKGAGVLQKIEAAEGTDVKVGDVLGRIDEKVSEEKVKSEKVEEQKPEPTIAETRQSEPQAEKEGTPPRSDGQQMERLRSVPEVERRGQPAAQVSPVAARLARDKNVDITKITGTGNEGRVTKADVEMYLQEQQAQRQRTEEKEVKSEEVQRGQV